jgi:MarR family multiple gene transcriptional regulator MgrA
MKFLKAIFKNRGCFILDFKNLDSLDLDSEHYGVADLIIQLGNSMTWLRNQMLQRIELTSSQADVMLFILRHKGDNITAKSVADYLGLSQSTMAGIIKRLEGKSLITRRTDTIDGRKSLIVPTEELLALEEGIKKTTIQAETMLLQGMSEEEQSELSRLLQIALGNINSLKIAGGRING